MKDSEIKVFVEGVERYFMTVSEQEAVVSAPYLTDPQDIPSKDFTGIIGVSGERKGCVYVSAPRVLLHHLLLSLGETNIDDELLSDLVGEVANTVSGNVREQFGAGFMISIPVVIRGRPEKVHLPKKARAFIVPFRWRNYPGELVVCLE